MNGKVWITLFLIILLAAFLRLYKLDQIPPSLSWDEAANGYNAYTIANWGKDEWGKSFPLVFKSFEDDKHPVHVYFTALSVKFLGLTEFSTRLPVAVLGVFNVIVIFFLAKSIFASSLAGLITALSLAVSPYAIQFSRFNHEANFALFFWMLGLLLFLLGVDGKRNFFPLAFVSWGLSLFSYHSSKIVLPPLILLLLFLYFKNLLKAGRYFLISCLVVFCIFFIFLLNPALLGGARIKQAGIDTTDPTKIVELTFNNYLLHFIPKYLFISGNENKKFSSQVVGEFYKIDLPFLIIGFLGIIWGLFFQPTKRGMFLVLMVWVLLAPLPSSLTKEAPHAARALFMMGSWHLVSTNGLLVVLSFLKKPLLQSSILIIWLVILGILFKNYLVDYYQNYAKKYSIDWQYGMKQIVEYVKEHNGYFRVYTTDIRSQPYIFFLYYLKTPLPEFLGNVEYNTGKVRSYSLVSSFDKYHFGDWDPIESTLTPGVLYAVSPSQYDGLRHRDTFDVKQKIYYLDGGDAFFLVSYP